MFKYFCLAILIVATTSSAQGFDDTCTECIEFFDGIKADLGNKTDQEQIVFYLEVLCTEFPKITDSCISFVDSNIPTLMEILSNYIDSKVLCHKLGLCSQKRQFNLKNLIQKSIKQVEINTPCLMCDLLLNATADALRNAKNEEYVQKVLDYECYSFGQFYKQCQSFVDKHTKEILDAIASDVDPSIVCPYIGLCPNKTSTTTVEPTTTTVEPTTTTVEPTTTTVEPETSATSSETLELNQVDLKTPCLMCNLLLNATDNALRNPENVEYVRKVLSYECFLFGQLFEECQAFVNNHTEEIFEALAEDIDPSVVCPYIGLCPTQSTTTVEPQTTTFEPTTTFKPATTTLD